MDIGERAAGLIWDVLQIDEEWAARTSRGYRWWAHDVAQEVEAGQERAFEGDRAPYARVVVRTPVLRRPAAEPDSVLAALSDMNGFSTGGAFRQADDGTIVHEASATVTGETVGGISRLLAASAILALTEGVAVAQAFSGALGAPVARSAHPRRGLRDDPDDILNVTGAVVLPTGAGPSRWGDVSAFAAAARMVNGLGVGLAADEECERGLLCEFGFGDHETSLALVVPTAADRGGPAAPGLPEARPDARLGNGMLGWLLLPMVLPRGDAAELAAELNRREGDLSLAGAYMPYHLGAWTVWDPEGRPTVAYRAFVPNMLADIVTPESLAHHMWLRSRLASGALLPGEEQLAGPALGAFLLGRLQGMVASPAAEPGPAAARSRGSAN